MNESTFTAKLRKFLEDNGGGSIKLGASVFLAKGTPDMICFFDRETFFLEDKVHPYKASPIQLATIAKIRKEGGYAWIATAMPNGNISLDGKEFDDIGSLFRHCVSEIRADRKRNQNQISRENI